jgi:hypothetical protein
MIFIKLSRLQQFIYNSLLLASARPLWNESGILHHRFEVEVGAKAHEKAKLYVQ